MAILSISPRKRENQEGNQERDEGLRKGKNLERRRTPTLLKVTASFVEGGGLREQLRTRPSRDSSANAKGKGRTGSEKKTPKLRDGGEKCARKARFLALIAMWCVPGRRRWKR